MIKCPKCGKNSLILTTDIKTDETIYKCQNCEGLIK